MEVRWCVGPTHLLTSQKPPHRVEFGFAHQNELTPPPLGGRARYRLFGSLGFSRREARCFSAGKDGRFVSEGFSRQLPLATAAHNWVTLAQQGRCGASLVSLPYSAPKTAHRATQGQVWFWLAGWRFSGGSPPFRQSRIRTQAEEKIPLPHFSEMEPVKSVIPCKRFFKPSGVKSFSLFMRRKFCGGIPVRKELSRLTFSPYKAANPACPGPGSYHLNLWRGRLTPPCLAPICTPRPRG